MMKETKSHRHIAPSARYLKTMKANASRRDASLGRKKATQQRHTASHRDATTSIEDASLRDAGDFMRDGVFYRANHPYGMIFAVVGWR